jgi:hypothetical protein
VNEFDVKSGAKPLPEVIHDESELDQQLTEPSDRLLESVRSISSPLLILGAGGKMGPSLAILAHRAAQLAGHKLEVVAVSRFNNAHSRAYLESQGVKTMGCDLLDAQALRQLPEAQNIVYLVGMKFGTSRNSAATWALNTLVPARVCERYRHSQIVALSTGNVYPMSEVNQAGSVETDALTPLGEYANAAVGRERIFEFCSRLDGPLVVLLRLFYAVDLRYGILADIARMVYTRRPISLATGMFNCIWQGDANDMILRAFPWAACPPSAWNLCRPELLSVRQTARRFGELFGQEPIFSGTESSTALLGNSSRLCAVLGHPPTSLDTMIRWTAHWVNTGGRDLGRPTHFEVRDGKY